MTGLTALQVKNAKPGRHADGRGLYLLVRESGSRSWVLRTQVEGRRQDIGLGSTSKLSLADARAKAAEIRSRILNGDGRLARIERAVAAMDSPMREVFLTHRLESLAYPAIAERLGISVAEVERCIAGAMAQLVAALEDREAGRD